VRVVVVGAGVGGLAAAARLAAAGHQVSVVERSERAGGKVAVYRRDGYAFDTGPALLTVPEVFEELFRATGDPLASCLELRRLDPAVRYRFPAGDGLQLPGRGAASVLEAMSQTLGPAAAGEWGSLLADWERLWPVLRDDVLGRELGVAGLTRLLLRRPAELRRVAPWRSLGAHSRRRLSDPRLRAILDRYASYAGSDPGRVPAVLGVIAYVEQVLGCWHVVGGIHRLVEALAARVGERGALIRCGVAVRSVEIAGGRVAAVRLSDGGRLAADVVVSDVDADELYGGLVEAPDGYRPLRTRLPHAAPSLSAFSILLATEERGPPPPHHLVSFPADYGREYPEVFAGQPATDPAIHVCAPDDAQMHPAGARGWSLLVNAPRQDRSGRPGTVDWTAAGTADRYADRLLDLLAARGVDVPPVRWRVVRTPADIERESAAPGGSIYGSTSRRPATAFLRPANRSRLPGLFLVGGSAHPGGGLPLVALSARIVARLVGPA
jgi:phytoene desaturase